MRLPGMEYLRSLLRRYIESSDVTRLERRADPVTISVTETITTTLAVSVTVTEHQNVTVFTTIISTETKTVTATTTKPITHSKLVVVPTTTTLTPTTSRIPPPPISVISAPTEAPVTGLPTPSAAPLQHHLSKSDITAIIIAAIVGLGLICFGAWLASRKFLQKYRGERVLRKKAQTEGTEMPPLPAYTSADPTAGQKDEGKWPSVRDIE